ncbi:MAG: alpha/beta fold hydrolase [Blastocatellia bacterium]|nr:alpha/beta fold hydrolase [Blastocatellia bacterium]
MKIVFRNFILFLIAMGLAPLARAQEGPTRAEFECLSMAYSSRRAVPGTAETFSSFHHVWIPGVRYGYFQSNGLELLYDMEGDGQETVVVVHGGPGLPHEYFHPMLSNLAQYAKLVFFDRRADMSSSLSPHKPVSLDEMADDLDALRQSLDLTRVTLLGHSFGGAIALNYALRYPDKVKRLILTSTSGMIEGPAEVESRLVKVLSPDEKTAYYSNEGSSGANTPCDRVRKRYRALYPHYFRHVPDAATLDGGVYAAYFDMLARKMVLASEEGRFDVRARLSEIKAPTLIIGGRHDLVTPVNHSVEMAKEIPHSKLVVMEHSGHFPFFEENYMFTQWVRSFMMGTKDLRDDSVTKSIITASTGSSQ